MPLWAVAVGLANPPPWLSLHVAQSTAISLLQNDGTLKFHGSEAPTGLSYCAERGILIAPRTRPITIKQETWHDEDESYD
jgi:hypothetical protein